MSKRIRGLVVSVGAASIASVAMGVWAGCSGSVETTQTPIVDSGPGTRDVSTTPVPPTDGGAADTSIPAVDATLPPKDAGGAFPGDAAGIACGATVCTGTDVCCATITDAGGTATCAPSCGDAGFTVACDGPEDCMNANLCCADFKVGAGTGPNCPIVSAASSCTATCKTKLDMACPGDSTLRLCHKLADCANEPSGATDCCQITRGGLTATFCVDPTFAQFIPGAMCL